MNYEHHSDSLKSKKQVTSILQGLKGTLKKSPLVLQMDA
jgi:hypothetical protein